MTSLSPATFDQWIAALESGAYEKGKEQLRSDDGFCCLGVLADIEGCGWAHYQPLVNEVGGYGHEGFEWWGASGGELVRFLGWVPPRRGEGLSVMRSLIRLNDDSETFEPVIARARELYAEWKAAQP